MFLLGFKPVDKENFKYQMNFLLKRNDGAYFITNILTIKKENDVLSTDGFNVDDQCRIFASLEACCCVEEEIDPLQVEINKLENEVKSRKLIEDDPENKNKKNRSRKILIVILSCCGIGIFGVVFIFGHKS